MRNCEKLDDISGPTAVDRVIDETNARTFDMLGVEVLILDNQTDGDNEIFEGCEVLFENPVPIFRSGPSRESFDLAIGTASLYLEGKRVMADMFLAYDTPERLSIEAGEKLYPAVEGSRLELDMSKATLDSSGIISLGPLSITKICVRALVLSISPNSDPRIGPL